MSKVNWISAEQEVFQKGQTAGALRVLRQTVQGLLEDRFGPLPQWLVDRVAAITDVERLQTLARQVNRINSLDEVQL